MSRSSAHPAVCQAFLVTAQKIAPTAAIAPTSHIQYCWKNPFSATGCCGIGAVATGGGGAAGAASGAGAGGGATAGAGSATGGGAGLATFLFLCFLITGFGAGASAVTAGAGAGCSAAPSGAAGGSGAGACSTAAGGAAGPSAGFSFGLVAQAAKISAENSRTTGKAALWVLVMACSRNSLVRGRDVSSLADTHCLTVYSSRGSTRAQPHGVETNYPAQCPRHILARQCLHGGCANGEGTRTGHRS